MPAVDEFGVIPVARGLEGKLLVQKVLVFPSEEDVRRAGRIFAEVLGGAVAFRRVRDPEAGFIGQGIIIGRFGVLAEAERSDPAP